LFGVVIAAVSVLLISSRAGKIAAQPATNNDDQQILLGMVRQVAEGIPRQLNFGGPSPNPYLEFNDFVGTNGASMGQTFDNFARRNLTVTRVEVGVVQIGISADAVESDGVHHKVSDNSVARLDFLGTIYFKDPARNEERSAAERYTVTMVKV